MEYSILANFLPTTPPSKMIVSWGILSELQARLMTLEAIIEQRAKRVENE